MKALESCYRGKLVTKSMPQEVNLYMGIDKGFSRPVGKNVESLVFLQTSHAEVNLLTQAHSFGYQKRAK